MKKLIIGALLAFALALNIEAKDKDKPEKPDKPTAKVHKKKDKDIPLIIVDPIGKDNYEGHVYSVPDTGSTALLLGIALLVLGLASRRLVIS